VVNERIKKLAEQATETVRCGLNGTSTAESFDREKFAMLIIQECARVARATPCPYLDEELRQRLGHTWDMASLEAGREIIKHFGVEK
jgi:hypothetical protein